MRVVCLTMHWALVQTSLHSSGAGRPTRPQPAGWTGPCEPSMSTSRDLSDLLCPHLCRQVGQSLWNGTKALWFSKDRLGHLRGAQRNNEIRRCIKRPSHRCLSLSFGLHNLVLLHLPLKLLEQQRSGD